MKQILKEKELTSLIKDCIIESITELNTEYYNDGSVIAYLSCGKKQADSLFKIGTFKRTVGGPYHFYKSFGLAKRSCYQHPGWVVIKVKLNCNYKETSTKFFTETSEGVVPIEVVYEEKGRTRWN